MLGLAAVAAAAVMSFIDAGAASAAPHELIGLCKKAELLLCKEIIPRTSGDLLGLATNPVLEGTLNEKCEKGHVNGVITSEEDKVKPLKGEITEASFTNCGPCEKVTVNGLPYQAELGMGTVGGNDWTLTVNSHPNATLVNCPFVGNCKFGAEKIVSSIEMTETKAIANTNKAELKREEGSAFCGSTGKWNAKYELEWKLLPSGTIDPTVFPTLLGEV